MICLKVFYYDVIVSYKSLSKSVYYDVIISYKTILQKCLLWRNFKLQNVCLKVFIMS